MARSKQVVTKEFKAKMVKEEEKLAPIIEMPPKDEFKLRIENGLIGDGYDACRATVVNSVGKKITEFNVVPIQEGFGITPTDAINDFIRRNSSDVLNKIFDE